MHRQRYDYHHSTTLKLSASGISQPSLPRLWLLHSCDTATFKSPPLPLIQSTIPSWHHQTITKPPPQKQSLLQTTTLGRHSFSSFTKNYSHSCHHNPWGALMTAPFTSLKVLHTSPKAQHAIDTKYLDSAHTQRLGPAARGFHGLPEPASRKDCPLSSSRLWQPSKQDWPAPLVVTATGKERRKTFRNTDWCGFSLYVIDLPPTTNYIDK